MNRINLITRVLTRALAGFGAVVAAWLVGNYVWVTAERRADRLAAARRARLRPVSGSTGSTAGSTVTRAG